MLKRQLFALIALFACLVNVAAVHATQIDSASNSSPRSMAQSTAKSPAMEALKKGVAALNKGDLKAAESGFTEALRSDPKQAGALIGLAEIHLRRKQPAEAEAQLKKALAIQPNSAEVHIASGRFHVGQRQYPQAEAEYKKAIALDKESSIAWVYLGDLYLTVQHNPKEAEVAYRQAVAIQPTYGSARLGLGMALSAQGKKNEAIEALREAARLTPEDPAALHIIGRIYAQQKMFEQAVQALTGALKVKPDFAPALNDRADVYAEMKKDSEAANDYQRIVRDHPDDSVAQLKLGMIYQRLDRINDAEAAYHAALLANPKLPPAYNNLAMLMLTRGGKATEALYWARKAVELSPNVPQFHDTLGWAYRAGGDKIKAVEELDKATHLKPPQAEIFYRFGIVNQEAGKIQDARAAYKKALQLQPNYPDAKQALASLEAGRMPSAP